MPRTSNSWTLAELVAQVEVLLDDSSNERWAEADIEAALRAAVRAGSFAWWEERLDSSQEFAVNTYGYDLPPACHRVLAVYFEPVTANNPRRFVTPNQWYEQDGKLYFQNKFAAYTTKDIFVEYMVHPSNLLDIDQTDGVLLESAATLTSAASTFVADGVREGDEVYIPSETPKLYYVSSITSETVLVITPDPTDGSTKTFYVAHYTDMPIDYLVNYAAGWLYELAGRNRPGVEVEVVTQWASYYAQKADLAMRRNAKRMKSRREF